MPGLAIYLVGEIPKDGKPVRSIGDPRWRWNICNESGGAPAVTYDPLTGEQGRDFVVGILWALPGDHNERITRDTPPGMQAYLKLRITEMANLGRAVTELQRYFPGAF